MAENKQTLLEKILDAALGKDKDISTLKTDGDFINELLKPQQPFGDLENDRAERVGEVIGDQLRYATRKMLSRLFK